MKAIQLRILTVLFVFNMTSCGHIKTEKTGCDDGNSIKVDKSVIAIMKLDSTTNELFQIFENSTPTNLTNQDLITIEKILRKSVENYNLEIEKFYTKLKQRNPDSSIEKKDFILDLRTYKRQYFAVENKKGEKEVWVNCFCDESETDWRKKLIYVFDGGNCYFNLKINLTTKEYYKFSVNSRA